MQPHYLLVVVCLFMNLHPGADGIAVVPHFSDVTIECDPSGVTLTVNSTALGVAIPGLDPRTVKVGQGPWLEHCMPVEGEEPNRGIETFKFNYGDCHPDMEELTNTMLKLTYYVTGDVMELDDDAPADADVEQPEGTSATCLVPKDGLIGADIESDTNKYEYVGNHEGTFQFGMTLYKDAFMTAPVDKEEEIPLGIPLWLGIKLNSSDSSEMFVRDCWATPSPTNSAEQPEHIFIKNGLIGEDDETFSPMDDVITATTYGFSFDSFMFRGAGTRVYIKCHVHVCDSYAADVEGCSIPKYPEFHVSARDTGLFGSGSGSGFGLSLRDIGDGNEEEEELEDETDEANDDGEERDTRDVTYTGGDGDSDNVIVDGQMTGMLSDVIQKEHPVYFIMHSFQVKHVERKRRSTGSYRVYPRHTMFSNLRSGIYLGIIIVSTAMFSACAILLPLHLSGEKVRCLHVKPTKRNI